ncbi:hypothetical protein QR680_007817 [Steinernema hermaphroditum]|uniref:ZP domain-containing protein n=1 Tax=Steinernema hermaphroditum TaxID=289476 RepID=A0AA39M703_9BILA|nr:hypothetical protein QR680_007817 [Steinernema hermaphroditum]
MLRRLSLLVLALTAKVFCFQIENGVIGQPEVECGVDSIGVQIITERPFGGRLYVQGESENPDCVSAFRDGEKIISPGSVNFNLRFGACNMRRQRTLNPRGVTYSFTLVVSFHPVFVTGVDKAYNVRCFFMESVKAVDTALDVSRLTTQLIDHRFELPTCTYNLKQGYDGPFLRFANVGERVTHVWQCDQVAGFVYGMLIHSCYVDDGHGNKFDLIDDRGCGLDKYLLPEIVYDEHSITAYANTHVFKYADKVQLYFTCTVQLCFKHDGGCDGVTPPNCGGFHGHEDFPGHDGPSSALPGPHHEHEEDTAEKILKEHKEHAKEFFAPIDSHDFHVPPPPEKPRAGFELPPLKDSPLNDTDVEEAETRRFKKHLETDLSADLTVMPFTSAEASLSDEPNRETVGQEDVCFSNLGMVMLMTASILFTFISSTVTAIFVRRRELQRKAFGFHG